MPLPSSDMKKRGLPPWVVNTRGSAADVIARRGRCQPTQMKAQPRSNNEDFPETTSTSDGLVVFRGLSDDAENA